MERFNESHKRMVFTWALLTHLDGTERTARGRTFIVHPFRPTPSQCDVLPEIEGLEDWRGTALRNEDEEFSKLPPEEQHTRLREIAFLLLNISVFEVLLERKNRGCAFLDRVWLFGEPSAEVGPWTKPMSFSLYLEQRWVKPGKRLHIDTANVLYHGKVLTRLVPLELFVQPNTC